MDKQVVILTTREERVILGQYLIEALHKQMEGIGMRRTG
jgi:hypothetical protein